MRAIKFREHAGICHLTIAGDGKANQGIPWRPSTGPSSSELPASWAEDKVRSNQQPEQHFQNATQGHQQQNHLEVWVIMQIPWPLYDWRGGV